MSPDRHLTGLCTRLLLEFVEWRLGADGVGLVLADAEEDRSEAFLRDDATWSSYAQFRRLLESAARHLGSVDELIRLGEIPSIGAGSRPEVTALLHAYGSPLKMSLSVDVGGLIGPAVEITIEASGPTEMITRAKLVGDFDPFPELCAFLTGLSSLSPRIFGMQPHVQEISCRCRGDDECAIRVAWDQTEDLALQLDFTRFQLGVSESRLSSVHRTVEHIVTTDDLDTVMNRIVDGAAHSSTASSFVLEVDAMPGGARLYTGGVDQARAVEMVASADAGGGSFLVVDVASNQKVYGRLIALYPPANLGLERPALEGYARLAATALDSAFALEAARRQAEMNRALLDLSTSLAELTAAGELAAKVARTMPAVIDCDCSVVLLIRDGVYRVAAHYGFGRAHRASLDAFEVTVNDHPLSEVVIRSAGDPNPLVAAVLAATGMNALAAAPVWVGREVIGVLAAGVRERPERFMDDPHLAERFSGLAGQAAVALRNGRLLDQIRHQSLHDPLTDLPNRALILDRADQMMTRARRHRHQAAVLFIDLDDFKEINDTLGHGAGDGLLQIVAERLRTTVRSCDTIGRLGGDEFVVLVEDAAMDAGVEAVAERLLEVLAEPLHLPESDQPLVVRASIGIATGAGCGPSELLRDADMALYNAKAAGKACYRVFAPEMEDIRRCRAELAAGLSVALQHEEFFLVYQPIFDLGTETVIGVEALLRWNHPERGTVVPDEFIPLLEESGQIVDVGRWVLNEACRQTAVWHACGNRIEVSVNASVRQIERPEFVDHVHQALAASGLPPASLMIEITETAIMRDAQSTVAVLHQLKSIGVRIAIDDFGTGYSSLAYLRQFPVDALKIDRSFIAAVADSPAAGELIHTLVGLGKALHLETLAEGIEYPQQLEHLQREGCDSGQGYLFARGVPASEMTDFLSEHHVGISSAKAVALAEEPEEPRRVVA
jgi:diguanylate cyclase (GGDEF)-like protein